MAAVSSFGRLVLAVVAVLMVAACTGTTPLDEPSSGLPGTSDRPVDAGEPSQDPSAGANGSPTPQPTVKASSGPPWLVEGAEGVSVGVAEPEPFSADASLEVPSGYVAMTLPITVTNEGEEAFLPGSLTAVVATSEPCMGFASLADGITGLSEAVEGGARAEFAFGFLCKGESGEKVTMRVAVDRASPVVRIRTTIP